MLIGGCIGHMCMYSMHCVCAYVRVCIMMETSSHLPDCGDKCGFL